MIAIGDAMLDCVPLAGFPFNGFDELNAFGDNGRLFLQELGLASPLPATDYQIKRHGGRWNVLDRDGHVLGQSTKQFLDPRSDAVMRSRYRDHVPHVDSLTAAYRR